MQSGLGTEVENIAEQRALERAGLLREAACVVITSATANGGTATSTASRAATGPADRRHRCPDYPIGHKGSVVRYRRLDGTVRAAAVASCYNLQALQNERSARSS